jgi:hypothetical protein
MFEIFLLTHSDVIKTCKKILNWAKDDKILDVEDFIDYINTVYIRKFQENCITKIPIYDINFWNVTHRVLNKIPRTTNAVKGWHRGFNKKTNKVPNIARSIRVLQEQEELNRISLIKAKSKRLKLTSEILYMKKGYLYW